MWRKPKTSSEEQFRAIHACLTLPWTSSSLKTFNVDAVLLVDKLGPREKYFQISTNVEAFQTEFETNQQGIFKSKFENEELPNMGWLQSVDKLIQSDFVWPIELQKKEEEIRILLCSALCKFMKELYAHNFVCGGFFPLDLVAFVFSSNLNLDSDNQPLDQKYQDQDQKEKKDKVYVLATNPTRFVFDASVSYTTHLWFPFAIFANLDKWISFFSMDLLQSILQGQFVVKDKENKYSYSSFYMQADSYLLPFADLWSILVLLSQLLSPGLNLLKKALDLGQEGIKKKKRRGEKQKNRSAQKRTFLTGPYRNWERTSFYQALRQEEEKRLLLLAPEPVSLPTLYLLSFEQTKEMQQKEKKQDLIDSLARIYYKVESNFLIEIFRNINLKLSLFFQQENNDEFVQTQKEAINNETNWDFEQDWKEVEKLRYSSLWETALGTKNLDKFQLVTTKLQSQVASEKQKQNRREKKPESAAEAALYAMSNFLESPFLQYFVALIESEILEKLQKARSADLTLRISLFLLRFFWKPALFSTLNSKRLEKAIPYISKNHEPFDRKEEKGFFKIICKINLSNLLNLPVEVLKDVIVEPIEPVESPILENLDYDFQENKLIPSFEFSFEQSGTALVFEIVYRLGDGAASPRFQNLLHLWLYAQVNERYPILRTCSVIAPLQLAWEKTEEEILVRCTLKFVEERDSIVRFLSPLSDFFLLLQSDPHQAATAVALKLVRDIGLALFILHRNGFSYTLFPHADRDEDRNVSFPADSVFICSRTEKQEISTARTYFSNEASWKRSLPVFFATLVDFFSFSLCAKQEKGSPGFLLEEEEAYRFFVLSLFYKKFASLESKSLSLRTKKNFLKKWAGKSTFKTLKSFFHLEKKQSLWLQNTFCRDSFQLEDLKGWLFPNQCKNSTIPVHTESRKEEQKEVEETKKENEDANDSEGESESENKRKDKTQNAKANATLTSIMTKKGFLHTVEHQTDLDFNACYFLLPFQSEEWPSLSFKLHNLNFDSLSNEFFEKWFSTTETSHRFSLSSQLFAALETLFRLKEGNELFNSLAFHTQFDLALAFTSVWFNNLLFSNGILSKAAKDFFSDFPLTFPQEAKTDSDRDFLLWTWVTTSNCFNSGLLALLSPFANFEQESLFLSQIVTTYKEKKNNFLRDFRLPWMAWLQCNFLPPFVQLFLGSNERTNEGNTNVNEVFKNYLKLLGSANPNGVDSLQVLRLDIYSISGEERKLPILFFRNPESKKLTYSFSLPSEMWDHWVSLCLYKDMQHFKVWRANAKGEIEPEMTTEEDLFQTTWECFSLFVPPADAKENLVFDKKKKRNYASFQKLNVFIWDILVDKGLIPFLPFLPDPNEKKKGKRENVSQVKRIDFEDLELRFFDYPVKSNASSSRGTSTFQILFCDEHKKNKRTSQVVPFQQIFCLQQLEKERKKRKGKKKRKQKDDNKFHPFQQTSTIQSFNAELFEKGSPSLLLVGQRRLVVVLNGSPNQGNYLFLDFLNKTTGRIQKMILLPGQVLITDDLEGYFRLSARDPLAMVLIVARISRF